ncbi:flagellar basal-body MS-ring/collar protein FliF [Actinokineospora auranticolor]|uniref:Flagellar M-ring protein n=1 Tax=Actinokineospora auranticolor TaxID=155976 RepID=A0A2S6GMN5_9PSEU|nr:flagellar basal-body MS-ring/collar protein FliF [Actinokineospora auranticolor]PPK66477.1 flagellar M-ring protein FliF [Actinokineospora auranticolor]
MNQDRIMVLLRRVGSGFKAFSVGQKAVVVAGVLVAVIGVWVYFSFVSTTSYSPLFSNLATKDASAITDELTTKGVSYELADSGATVMVPTDQLYQLRLDMAAAGLPASEDTGYALLDQQGVTTSDFMQQVTYQRALEGELTKTIKSINGVTAASVHLAIPTKDVFSDASAKPTASVMVSTGAGKKLSDDQVQTIIHLVASAVEGMDPTNVTVAGSDGTVLAAPGQGSTGSTSARQQETAAYEQRVSTSLQALLTQVVGANKAVVKVTADLDFDTSETKSQTYTKSDAPALSESTTNEAYSGTGAGAAGANGGVLGQTNGLTTDTTTTDSSSTTSSSTDGNGSYKQEKAVRDNAVNSVIETRQNAPGQVRKLGVAVLLDQSTAAAANLEQIRQLASSAVGLDTTRGDTIAVSALPFDQSAANTTAQEVAAQQASDQKAEQFTLIKQGAAALAVLVLLVVTWLATRRRRKNGNVIRTAELERLDAIKAELERTRQAALDTADERARLEAAADRAALSAGINGDNGPQEQKLKEIEALVDEQPDEVARLLRGWLATKGA